MEHNTGEAEHKGGKARQGKTARGGRRHSSQQWLGCIGPRVHGGDRCRAETLRTDESLQFRVLNEISKNKPM